MEDLHYQNTNLRRDLGSFLALEEFLDRERSFEVEEFVDMEEFLYFEEDFLDLETYI